MERAIADGREAGWHETHPVRAEVHEQRDQRPDVEHHAERQRGDERIVPAEQKRHHDQVPDEDTGRNSVSPCTIPMISA